MEHTDSNNPRTMAVEEPSAVKAVENRIKHMRKSTVTTDFTPYATKEGYICKVGSDVDELKYFVLNNHYLNYWTKKQHFVDNNPPVGSFDLRQVERLWFDGNTNDINFLFADGSYRVLNFNFNEAKTLIPWYQAIDKRLRYFKGLGAEATAETSLESMRQQVQAKGFAIADEEHKQLPSEVANLKKHAHKLKRLRRKTMGIPATPIVKRFGYRKSVISMDKTPYPRVQGYLKKQNGQKYYQLNNEYMSYWKDKNAWENGKTPLGSYNLIHVAEAHQDGQSLNLTFVDGQKKSLKANSKGIARQWVDCINLRRQWFRDINTADESEEKILQKTAQGEQVGVAELDRLAKPVLAPQFMERIDEVPT